MRLVVAAVGKLRDRGLQEGCDDYLRRVRRHVPCEVTEARDDAALVRALGRLEPAELVALDERGAQVTTEELSRWMAGWLGGGRSAVALVIGGADGLPAAVRARADRLLGLSRLTLPHRVCRLILLEQLYRALSMLRGEPYHRSG